MLTPEAKMLLAETIRGTSQDPAKGLRARLLRAIHDEADRRYRLSTARLLAQAERDAVTNPKGKADLYPAFVERGLQFARPGGVSALVTMRGWMFLGQFAELRIFKELEERIGPLLDQGARVRIV